jgi:hypothetical protein
MDEIADGSHKPRQLNCNLGCWFHMSQLVFSSIQPKGLVWGVDMKGWALEVESMVTLARRWMLCVKQWGSFCFSTQAFSTWACSTWCRMSSWIGNPRNMNQQTSNV